MASFAARLEEENTKKAVGHWTQWIQLILSFFNFVFFNVCLKVFVSPYNFWTREISWHGKFKGRTMYTCSRYGTCGCRTWLQFPGSRHSKRHFWRDAVQIQCNDLPFLASFIFFSHGYEMKLRTCKKNCTDFKIFCRVMSVIRREMVY